MKRKQSYIATKGDERIEGTVHVVAEKLGATAGQIYRHSFNHRLLNGYKIERAVPFSVLYLARWDGSATRKTIKGTARMIADYTGMSESNVPRLAKSGHTSLGGWKIERITEWGGVNESHA